MIESGCEVKFTSDTPTARYFEPTDISEHSAQLKGIPNPHHKYYNCWGDNEPEIQCALADRKLDIAYAQIITAMVGINISDTAVMSKFVENELYTYRNVKCLRVKDTGEIITITEYKQRRVG